MPSMFQLIEFVISRNLRNPLMMNQTVCNISGVM